MSAWTCRQVTARLTQRLFRLVLESHTGRAFCAESEEKHEPVSDIDTVLVDSLKALDLNRPIREADIAPRGHRQSPGAAELCCMVSKMRAWLFAVAIGTLRTRRSITRSTTLKITRCWSASQSHADI